MQVQHCCGRTLLDLAEDELKELPMALEVLLKRMKLNSFDARTLYIR